MKISNWFKPKWKNSNPAIRLAEIKSLDDTNQGIFVSVVKEDEDIEVRKVALERIHDLNELKDLLPSLNENSLSQIIKKKLELLALRQLRKSKEDNESLWEFIQKAKSFEELARNSKSADIRLKAISHIKNESTLTDLICREKSYDVAKSVIEKITKEKHWRKIKKYSSINKIRSAVSEKINVVEEQIKQKKHNELGTSKKETLLKGIKELADKNILDIADQIETLEKASAKLKADFPEVNTSELDQKLTQYKTDFSKAQKEAEEKEAASSAFQSIIEKVNGVIQTAEEQLNLKTVSKDLIDKWKSEFDEFEKSEFKEKLNSYKDSFSNLLQRAERKIKFQEDQEQKIEEIREHQKDLADQISLLVDKELTSELYYQVDSIKKNWDKILTKSGEPEESVLNQFNSAYESLNKVRSEREKSEKEEFESKSDLLNAIIETINKLEVDSTIEVIEKNIRDAHHQWKDVVGENKTRFIGLWKDFKEACSKFDEALQWKEWYAQKEKTRLVEEIQLLDKSELAGKELFDKLKELQDAWKKAGNVPSEVHQELWGAFKEANDSIMTRCQEYFDEMQEERVANLKQKEELCEELAAATAEVENWNYATKQVKEFQTRWKSIGAVPKEDNNKIWEKYRAICDDFFGRRREFLKIEEGNRSVNLEQKNALCEEVENIKESLDWSKTSRTIRDLQAKWKKIGPVPKADSDVIWKRFREACDFFYDARRVHFEELDKEKADNLAAKEAICAELEAFNFDELNDEIKSKVEELQAKWTTIGHVKKEISDQIWDRFCKSIDLYTENLAKQDPELQEEINKGIETKESIIKEAAVIVETNDWAEVSKKLQEFQKEWKAVGRVGLKDSELWTDFRAICDEFFERRRDQYEILEQARINNLEEKMLLIDQAENLAAGEHTDEARREIKMIRQNWKEIGHVPKQKANQIHDRFNKACNSLFQNKDEDE